MANTHSRRGSRALPAARRRFMEQRAIAPEQAFCRPGFPRRGCRLVRLRRTPHRPAIRLLYRLVCLFPLAPRFRLADFSHSPQRAAAGLWLQRTYRNAPQPRGPHRCGFFGTGTAAPRSRCFAFRSCAAAASSAIPAKSWCRIFSPPARRARAEARWGRGAKFRTGDLGKARAQAPPNAIAVGLGLAFALCRILRPALGTASLAAPSFGSWQGSEKIRVRLG